MLYTIYDADCKVLSSGEDMDKAIEDARKIDHDGVLIGTGTREDGSKFGFFASAVPGLAL